MLEVHVRFEHRVWPCLCLADQIPKKFENLIEIDAAVDSVGVQYWELGGLLLVHAQYPSFLRGTWEQSVLRSLWWRRHWPRSGIVTQTVASG